jgi:LacI family transcriptional regulator
MEPFVAHVVIGRNPFNTADVIRGMASNASELRVTINPLDTLANVAPGPRQGCVLVRSDASERRLAVERSMPAVALFSLDAAGEVPVIVPDDPGIGALAATHLVDRGFAKLAFRGSAMNWSRQRADGFVLAGRRAGAAVLEPSLEDEWLRLESIDENVRWLESLPKPVGVLCANDRIAVFLRDAALARGLRVPEDIGVVGVDNDELRSRYGPVPITSIELNASTIGARALQLLIELTRGQAVSSEPIIVPPGRLVERRSTDVLAISDPDVLFAARYIADHACDGIEVSDVLSKVMVSRSTLDRRMKSAIGRTCSDEIARVRLQRARRMLLESDSSMSEISAACGYNYLSHFSHAFSKAFGMPPSTFRETQRPRRT